MEKKGAQSLIDESFLDFEDKIDLDITKLLKGSYARTKYTRGTNGRKKISAI